MKPARDCAPGAPWVIKLGGSLGEADELALWLRACVALAPRVVLVSGGGAYADAVRRAQARWRFDDVAAHEMALVGMEMYARQCCAMQSGIEPCATMRDMQRALRRGCTPVWLPLRLGQRGAGIEPCWDMSSDSLAAWLARHLGAAGLVLVKSVARPPGDWDDVAAAGGVDRAFAQQAGELPVRWLQRAEHGLLARLIGAPTPASPLACVQPELDGHA